MPIDPQTGYRVPDYSELLDDSKNRYTARFGQDIDLSDTSTFGALANIDAENDQLDEQLGLALYEAQHVSTAVGSQLDDHGTVWGLYRKPASNSYVSLQIKAYVDSPTTINTENGKFSTAEGAVFTILDDVTISQQGKDSNGQPLMDEDGNALGIATVQAISEDTGAYTNVGSNTIVNAEQPVDGFYSVTNPEASTGGQDIETDDAFRNRIEDNILNTENTTANGLINAVRNLPDVTDARIVDNNSFDTDKYGNVPMSSHIYVIGGNDDEIANAIFTHQPPLHRMNGNVVKTVLDIAGTQHDIKFDHATNVTINLKVQISVDNNTFNQTDGISTIKNNIIQYFSGLRMGSTVDFTKLYAPCYSVAGIKSVSLYLSKNNDPVVANQNITVDTFELPTVAKSSIYVEIVGDSNV